MKFFILMVVGSLMATLIACAVSDIQELTQDTVEGELESGIPESWSLGGSAAENYSVYVDRGIVYEGGAAASMISFDAPNSKFGSFSQAIEAGEYTGNRIRFSAYMRTNSVKTSAGLWMRADADDRGAIAFDNMDDRRLVGTNEWRGCSVVLDIPDNAVVIHYGALLEGTGQIWIDECVLEIVGDDAETTEQYGVSFPRTYKPPANLQSMPANLDFEGGIVPN